MQLLTLFPLVGSDILLQFTRSVVMVEMLLIEGRQVSILNLDVLFFLGILIPRFRQVLVFSLVFELFVFAVDVFDLGLEVDKLILEGTEGVFELDYLLCFLLLLCGSLGDSVLIFVGFLLLDAVQFDDHLLPAMLFDQHAFVLEHILEFGVPCHVFDDDLGRGANVTLLPAV